jgi:hypothetical protein
LHGESGDADDGDDQQRYPQPLGKPADHSSVPVNNMAADIAAPPFLMRSRSGRQLLR